LSSPNQIFSKEKKQFFWG